MLFLFDLTIVRMQDGGARLVPQGDPGVGEGVPEQPRPRVH